MERIDKFLREREANFSLRVLHPAESKKKSKIRFNGREYIDYSSNDYLGLSGHPRIKEASKKAVEEMGTSASASRLLSGDLEIHHRLEEKTAAFKGKESALVFNSGYQANVGIISALCGRNDAVFSDRLNHASIVDGIILSGARCFRFRHNDIEHLELLLKRERHKYKEALIITETVFSMDGDKPPLKEIVELKERYCCKLMVDEAHATGIFGKFGSGVVEEAGLVKRVDLVMGTFSKALGSFGAYIAASKKMTAYLINSSRGFIYSTALPPAVVCANMASLDLIKEEPYRRQSLLENAAYFRDTLKKLGFVVKGRTQIVPLIVGENREALRMSRELQKKGHWVFPIRPPTVPSREARLRFSLTYYHDKETVRTLLDDIKRI